MQNKLQQVYKEYIDLKNYIKEDNKNLEELKKQAHNEAVELETLEEQAGYFFDKIGIKDVLRIDFTELQKKLYYFVQAYSELIEVPEEIKKEVEDYKVKNVFTVLKGEVKVVDKELYDFYKKQHQQYAIQISEYQKLVEGA